MKYLLIDKFDNTQKIVDEKYLRNLYFEHMQDIIFNWKDCGDRELLKGLENERDNADSCDINFVIKALQEDNWFYTINKIEKNKKY